MKIKQLLLGGLLVSATAIQAAGVSATFDWEEFAVNWWEGFGYMETNNGIVMTSSGRATGVDGGDGAGGNNGAALKVDYDPQDAVAGEFTFQENGADTYFVIDSIDISAFGGGEYTPTVKGTADGAVVWTIVPAEGVGFTTYTPAGMSSLTNPVNKIVWHTGVSTNAGANYQNQIDNLSITTADEPVFQEDTAVFDWEEFDGNWWDLASYSYAETNNGIVMQAGGRATASSGGDGPGGANGAALKAAYEANDQEPGTFEIYKDGSKSWFVVESIDIEANKGNPPESTMNPTVTGYAAGLVQWVIEPVTNAGLVTYTEATSGDLSAPIEKVVWDVGYHSNPGATFNNSIDNLNIRTVQPALEVIYNWNLGAFWTPHALYSWNLPTYGMDLLNFDQYWWSGGDTEGSPTVIKHRPGLADLPENGGFGGIPSDTNVGGLANRGVYVTEPARILDTNETLRVTYDWKMFVNGSDNGRFIDMFFSTTGNQSAKRFGETGTELGFAWYQTMNSNDVAITFAADDDYMAVTPPVLRIPLTDLGIDVGTEDHDGDELAVTYTAKKTTVPDTWLCSMIVSNKATAMSYRVEDVVIENAAAYNNPIYFCIYTADDLSDGDSVSGANPAGYEIDNLAAVILLNPPPEPEGFDAFLEEYGIAGEPNSGAFEDFDADGVLNLYEYGWAGNPTNPADVGVLPEMTVSNGVVYYTIVELTDPLSGISYNLLTTPDLVNIGFTPAAWDSTNRTPHDAMYDAVTRELSTSDRLFFKTTVTTNTP
ncbi:hypothetical protein EGM51_00185 [Verrucomicrobia bacterium S94]|nr:hypothetical protein EGM51_00185 [Verrucomicrobia bacterium S94]